ncbi:MAG: gluconokinase, GntK/IdnK-type [Steroidobacteraceae bacterium]|jgi:carbohydrate kinase (thermoresistant glucokinase family)
MTDSPRCSRLPVVVMGVSGSGKSTFGSALARAMGREFVDGDDLHSAANVDKMRRGQPLDDADRAPWLRAIAAVLADGASYPRGVVVACSSLKRAYRDALRAAHRLQFVFLDAARPLIERRLEARRNHFMSQALIASQFDVLERPDHAETDILTLDAAAPVDAAVRAAVDYFSKRSSLDESREDLILRSWRTNATSWARAIHDQRITSRTLVTNRAIVDTVLALAVRNVLDIGCGEGWLARALSLKGLAVTGIDATDSLIAEARTLGGGTFEVRDYADLVEGRFEHRDFDAAVCNFSLLGEDSVDSLCRAVRRYLKPSGYLVIQTLHPVAACGDHPYRDGWRPGSWSGFGPEFGDPPPWYFRTLNSWLALLRRFGYELVDCREPIAPDAPVPSSIIFVGRLQC